MRQLFVSACVCLMTWSSTFATESPNSLDAFVGNYSIDRPHHTGNARHIGETTGATVDVPAAKEPEIAREPPARNLEAPSSTDGTGDQPAARPNDSAPAAHASERTRLIPATSDRVTIAPEQAAQMPPPPLAARPVVHRSREEICNTVAHAAEVYDLPAPFLIKLLFQESRFDAGVVSAAGALGIAQFMPATAKGMGLENPFDPVQAISASARLLRNLVERFGNVGLAAAAYNAGPKRIEDWLKQKSRLPAETQGYVKHITGRPAEIWKGKDALPDSRLPRRAPCQEKAGLLAWNGPDTIPMPAPSPRREAVRIAASKMAEIAKAVEQKAKHKAAKKERVASIADMERKKVTVEPVKTKVQRGAVQLAARRHQPRQAAKKKSDGRPGRSAAAWSRAARTDMAKNCGHCLDAACAIRGPNDTIGKVSTATSSACWRTRSWKGSDVFAPQRRGAARRANPVARMQNALAREISPACRGEPITFADLRLGYFGGQILDFSQHRQIPEHTQSSPRLRLADGVGTENLIR